MCNYTAATITKETDLNLNGKLGKKAVTIPKIKSEISSPTALFRVLFWTLKIEFCCK